MFGNPANLPVYVLLTDGIISSPDAPNVDSVVVRASKVPVVNVLTYAVYVGLPTLTPCHRWYQPNDES